MRRGHLPLIPADTWRPGDGVTIAWFSQTPMGLPDVLFSGGVSSSSGIFNIKIRNVGESSGDGTRIRGLSAKDFKLEC